MRFDRKIKMGKKDKGVKLQKKRNNEATVYIGRGLRGDLMVE